MTTNQGGSDFAEPGLGTEPASQPLGRAAAAGTLWLAAQKWVSRLAGIVTIGILTRLISPSDFGVVAAATSITPFVLLLADLGLSTYVVQVSRLERVMLSSGFWLSVSVGLLLSVGLVAFAPLISAAFHLPDAAGVIRAMSISVLVTVLGSVPMALLRRRMAFKLLAFQSTCAALIGQVAAVVLAFRGAGAYALVAQLIIAQGLATLFAWYSAKWWPSFAISWRQLAEMARFGGKVVAVDVISSLRATAEAAIISGVLGAAALGYLSIAQRLVQVTQDLGATSLVPVSTVVFAKIRDVDERLQSAYLKALGIAYAAVSPVMTLVAVGSPLVIPIIFGAGWDPSVPLAQALAVAAILTLGAMLDHGLFMGSGQPGRWLLYASLVDGLTVATTAVAAQYGLTYVALSFVVVALFATLARWVIVSRLLRLRVRVIASLFCRAFVAVGGAAAAGLAARVLTDSLSPLVSLVCVGITIGIVHVGLVRVSSPRVFNEVLDTLPLPAHVSLRRLRVDDGRAG